MNQVTKLRALFALAFFLGVLGACNRGTPDAGKQSGSQALLEFVPADSPYVFSAGTPLPDKVQDKLEPKIDEILRAYQVVFRETFAMLLGQGGGEMTAEEEQRATAVVNELSTLLSIEGLRNAGFDRDSGLALYGNGLLPVLRIELSDPALFDAAIARIEQAAGESMSVATLDDQRYRFFGNDEMSLVIGAFGDNAVFSMMPSGFGDDQKRQLLGLAKPKDSIASAGTLKKIASEYGYSDHYIGFVDAKRVASIFTGVQSGLDVPLLAGMNYDAGELSDMCRTEIRAMADVAPRMVFGYQEISTEAMSGSAVLELRPDLALGLAKIAALVPGLGRDPGGLFSMGAGFDLKAMRAFYEARLDAIEADPFECEYFTDINASVAKGREALKQPLPPVVYGLRGFVAVVDDVGEFDMANNQPPKDLDASVLVALDDAEALVAMGAMFSPELAGLNLQADGKPVLLDLPQIRAMGQIVYAAMLADAVALSVGADAEARIGRVLKAESVTPPPLYSMSLDAGRYYALIAKSMTMGGDDDPQQELSRASREAMRDAMLVIGELYDRMTFNIRFTERGMEADSRVTLKD